MMRTALMAAVISVGWCATVTPAKAHLMPRQQGTINVRDSAVFCVFSIPVSALAGWDRDRNGRMSAVEFAAQQATITRQVDTGIRLQAGTVAGRRDFLQANLDLDDADTLAAQGATHLLVLVRQSFDVVPTDVQLRLSLFGAARDEQAFLIKATRGGAPEVGILEPAHGSRTFFVSARPGLAGGVSRFVSWVSGVFADIRSTAAHIWTDT